MFLVVAKKLIYHYVSVEIDNQFVHIIPSSSLEQKCETSLAHAIQLVLNRANAQRTWMTCQHLLTGIEDHRLILGFVCPKQRTAPPPLTPLDGWPPRAATV